MSPGSISGVPKSNRCESWNSNLQFWAVPEDVLFFLAPFAGSFHLADSRCRSFLIGIRLKISLSSQYVQWSPPCSIMELKYGFLTGCGYFLWFTIYAVLQSFSPIRGFSCSIYYEQYVTLYIITPKMLVMSLTLFRPKA